MQDRTSHSYRADTPGSNPDMYSQGGKAREAFREARCSPYVRQESQKQSQGTTKEQFKARRQASMPAPQPMPGR